MRRIFVGVVLLAAVGCNKPQDSRKQTTASPQEAKKEHAADGHDHDDHASTEEEHSHDDVTVSIEQQKAAKFEVAAAELRSSARTLQTTGTVKANETRAAHIRALSTGRITRVFVRAGDTVRKNHPLLTYDNIELGEVLGEYLRSAAAREQAKNELEVAARSLQRARALVDLGAIARAELDRRDAEHKNQQAAVRAQEAELARVEAKLRRFGLTDDEIGELAAGGSSRQRQSVTTLRAPFDGIVMQVSAVEGEAVQTDTPLLEVVDTSTVWIQADVYEQDLASVKVGQAAEVLSKSYPGEKFRGVVTLVADAVNAETRTTQVRVEAPNSERRLKLDMYVTVLLPTKESQKRLAIPAISVQTVGDRTCVFVREDDTTFAVRPVRLGSESRGWIEVLEGLKEGDMVVARGSFTLKSEHDKAELSEEGHHH